MSLQREKGARKSAFGFPAEAVERCRATDGNAYNDFCCARRVVCGFGGGATRPLEWRSWLGLAQGPHKHWLAGQGCDAIRIERSAMMLQQRGI